MTPLERILAILRERGNEARLSGQDWMCLCPVHGDENPSLSIREETSGGRIFVKCFAGCDDEKVLAHLGLTVKDLFPEEDGRNASQDFRSGLTLEELARAKKLPVPFLQSLGVETTWLRKARETPEKTVVQSLVDAATWDTMEFRAQWREVLIRYRHSDGSEARSRRRMRINADPERKSPKHCWAGTKDDGEIIPYGLDRLHLARDKDYLILVEGETDCWALWLHDYPTLGVPGASHTKTLKREHFDGIDRVYIVQEPDTGGETFFDAIRNKLSSWKTWNGELFRIQSPGGAKDVCDLRMHDPEQFNKSMDEALDQAQSVPLEQAASDAGGTKTAPPSTDEINSIIEKGSISHLFDNVSVFARLDKAEFGKLKARLKEAFGRDLNITDFRAAVRESRLRIKRETLRSNSVLPAIITSGRQLRDVVEDAKQALVAANEPPILFCRSGAIALLQEREQKGQASVHMKSLSGMDTPTMKDHLSRAADFFKTGPDGEDVPCNPPYDIASVILSRHDHPFPRLDGVTQSPVMREDGSILLKPGYDAASRLYYVPDSRLQMPDIPAHPTHTDVTNAVLLLQEMVCDFPFIDEACRTNLFALLLSIVMRPLIDGCIPLALIDAPRQGTGKGLLAAIVGLVTTGGEPAIMTAPGSTNDDEWRKRITSTLMGGPSVVLLDNIDEPLESPSFAAMLTAREWEDRRLGVSENVRLPVQAVWFGTGNNIQVHGDMPRRCYHVRIDSNLAQPWRRHGFRHPNLREWVMENRGRLLAALLTIARSWCIAGRPVWSGTPLGSFENWCRVIGGALEHAGIGSFLTNTDRLYEEADEETHQWIAFFDAWKKKFGSENVKVKELCSEILKYQAPPSQLRSTLPEDLVTAVDKGAGNLSRRLGIALRARRDTIHGTHRLVYAGQDSHDKVSVWHLEDVKENAPEDDISADFSYSFAGSENPTPAASPANITPLHEKSKNPFAGPAGFDPTYFIHARGLYKKFYSNHNIYKEWAAQDPANPAHDVQHVDNKDGYTCGFDCGSSISNPADPASATNETHSPPSGNEQADDPPDDPDEPFFERLEF